MPWAKHSTSTSNSLDFSDFSMRFFGDNPLFYGKEMGGPMVMVGSDGQANKPRLSRYGW